MYRRRTSERYSAPDGRAPRLGTAGAGSARCGLAGCRRGAALYAEAREASRGSKLASYTINVTDQNGALVAIFQGLAYRMDQTLEAAEASV